MFEGTLKKMTTEKNDPINYFLDMKEGFIHMNQCLGKKLSITHTGSQCLNCFKELPIFRQGYCKSCFFESPARRRASNHDQITYHWNLLPKS